MKFTIPRGLLYSILSLTLFGEPNAEANEAITVEAESLQVAPSPWLAVRKFTDAYAFADEKESVSGWFDLLAANGERNIAGEMSLIHLPISIIGKPLRSLKIRVLRWAGNASQSAPDTLVFELNGATMLVPMGDKSNDQVIPSGGVYAGEGDWKWVNIPLNPDETLPAKIGLAASGGVGPYGGILIDAFQAEFADASVKYVPDLPEALPVLGGINLAEQFRVLSEGAAETWTLPDSSAATGAFLFWIRADTLLPGSSLTISNMGGKRVVLPFIRNYAGDFVMKDAKGVILQTKVSRDGKQIYGPDSIFSKKELDWKDFAASAPDLPPIDWKGLSGSFVRCNVVDDLPNAAKCMDWFDDALWNLIAKKVGMVAKSAAKLGAVGILLDTELYNSSEFLKYHPDLAAQHSFEDVSSKVRERGAQIARAIEENFPNASVLFTFTTSYEIGACWDEEKGRLDVLKADAALSPAFIDGFLDASSLTLIDGHEKAYYHRTAREFIESVFALNETAQLSHDPEKYRSRIKKGFGLYLDKGPFSLTNSSANYFSPFNMELALHLALRFSDGPVWLYTERVNFWKGPDIPPQSVRPMAIPEDYYDVISRSFNPRDVLELPKLEQAL